MQQKSYYQISLDEKKLSDLKPDRLILIIDEFKIWEVLNLVRAYSVKVIWRLNIYSNKQTAVSSRNHTVPTEGGHDITRDDCRTGIEEASRKMAKWLKHYWLKKVKGLTWINYRLWRKIERSCNIQTKIVVKIKIK